MKSKIDTTDENRQIIDTIDRIGKSTELDSQNWYIGKIDKRQTKLIDDKLKTNYN